MLDAAFKRPGRVKKIRMENLAYDEFKSMILHFLPMQETGTVGGYQLPTVELWTAPIEELAQMVIAITPRTQHPTDQAPHHPTSTHPLIHSSTHPLAPPPSGNGGLLTPPEPPYGRP